MDHLFTWNICFKLVYFKPFFGQIVRSPFVCCCFVAVLVFVLGGLGGPLIDPVKGKLWTTY